MLLGSLKEQKNLTDLSFLVIIGMHGHLELLILTVARHALLEVAERLWKLQKKGWKPRRTIIFCNWDAEEYGLIGSTEWVEENRQMLASRVVAYLNVDSAVGGAGFRASATPQLDELLIQAAKQRSVENLKDEVANRGISLVPLLKSIKELETAATRINEERKIYAPSKHNDYGSTSFPGIDDALEKAKNLNTADSWHSVQHEIWRVARVITQASLCLKEAELIEVGDDFDNAGEAAPVVAQMDRVTALDVDLEEHQTSSCLKLMDLRNQAPPKALPSSPSCTIDGKLR
ncbi:UNVERIFIED_CONTAM: putative glutamate carboxypeptidase LAMP1 [Sesamum calycinum]|uniref:Glutamate carboxypeptidase LAMP1 n=1 Tax=Sesamum calycinum TaxID=2727403 RepID=A0AAW2NSV4_9LAMI